MIGLTKIFHFEMAHAIHGYAGDCKNIHGHSYELHITVSSGVEYRSTIPGPGFEIDFKEIKELVKTAVIDHFDHKLLLSRNFLGEHPYFLTQENLVTWETEPTAENLLIYIRQILAKNLPDKINLVRMKLYETKDSYAEWIVDNTFNK